MYVSLSIHTHTHTHAYIFHNSSEENYEDQVCLFGEFQTGVPGLHVSLQMVQD